MDNRVVVAILGLMLVAAVVLNIVNRNNVVIENVVDEPLIVGEGTKPEIDTNTDTINEKVEPVENFEDTKLGCIVTGCSNQICASSERITTCEYKEEYACYSDAVCEVQTNGECGWTLTEKARECLRDAAVFGDNAL